MRWFVFCLSMYLFSGVGFSSYEHIDDFDHEGEVQEFSNDSFLNERIAGQAGRKQKFESDKQRAKQNIIDEKRRKQSNVILMSVQDQVIEICVKLIEKQYDGITSIYHGVMILNSLKKHQNDISRVLDLKAEAQKALKFYKGSKTYRQKNISQQDMSILTQKLQPLSYFFRSFVVDKVNPYATCYMDFSFDVGAALVVKLGVGLNTAICTTPLGRKFRLFGASGNLGLGVGAFIESGFGGVFYIPLNSSPFSIVTQKSRAKEFWLAGGGTSEIQGKPYRKSKRSSCCEHAQGGLGIGCQVNRGKILMFRKALKGNYDALKRELNIQKLDV